MTPFDFPDDQNAMRRVIWGYIYTWKIKVHTKNNIMQQALAKFKVFIY